MKKIRSRKYSSLLVTALFAVFLTGEAAPAQEPQEFWHGRIYDVPKRAVIGLDEFVEKARHSQVIALGEKHYSADVQRGEAAIMASILRSSGDTAGNFITAWEFLSHSGQEKTDDLYARYADGEFTAEQFLEQAHGSSRTSVYAPVVEMTRAFGGRFLGVNLSQAEKAPVTEKGLEALDPSLLPPDFARGSADYQERFKVMMAGHGTPEQIERYWDAQCLTDDVMAYHVAGNIGGAPSFLIAGGFHVDFFGGVVARLKARLPGKRVTSVSVFDASDYYEDEILDLLHDPRYGDVADYVLIIGEPDSRP